MYLIIAIVIILSTYLYIQNKPKKDIVSDIKLEEIFYLKNNQTASYKGVSLIFSPKTLPISRDPVTGMEKYPYDVYQVLVSYKNGEGISKTETLTFGNTDISQKFSTDTMTYELHLIDYKDGVASFKLNTSFIEKHYERTKASYVLQITGGYFETKIFINNKYVNSIDSPNSIHTTGFLINKYLSYEMQGVPEGKIVDPDMQGHNTIRIGPIKTSSKDAKLYVKIIDKLNPGAIYFDKDINFDTLGNNTVEIDLQIESDAELVNQQQTLLE